MTFGDFADILTVIGFLITIGNFIYSISINRKIDTLQKKYDFLKYKRHYLKIFNETSKSLNAYLEHAETNKRQIRFDLFNCRANLKSLKNKLDKNRRDELEILLRLINSLEKKNFIMDNKNLSFLKKWKTYNIDDVWEIHGTLSGFIHTLTNYSNEN